MNKKSFILVSLLALATLGLKAQMFDFSNNIKDFTVGVNLGVVGYDFENGHVSKNIADFGAGVSVSLLGVYLDFIYQGPEHRFDRTITQEEYPDQTALTINLGYKIPVFSWLNITPVIGYSNETFGKTLGNSIGVDSEAHSIYHDYEVESRYSHFNYGVGLSFKPIDWLEFGGVCTAHAVYGNISVNLFNLKD